MAITMGRPKGAKSDPGRTPVDFKQSNVMRVVRAAQSLGLPISGIEVEPGTGLIRVLVGGQAEHKGSDATPNPWN